jgi:hypothetical protein
LVHKVFKVSKALREQLGLRETKEIQVLRVT